MVDGCGDGDGGAGNMYDMVVVTGVGTVMGRFVRCDGFSFSSTGFLSFGFVCLSWRCVDFEFFRACGVLEALGFRTWMIPTVPTCCSCERSELTVFQKTF